ncbi:hypothetical protein CRG98_005161 [Punica granatum]|uniref:Uncharacterized protein n=1 Tax=Punica granatum TaxID=22663 RepID=A0A2I0L163_PUNGR|nr:hypothetical protein CRG98_005161 [Punica granatum]
MGSRHERTLQVALGPSQRCSIGSVGPIRLACPHKTRLLEPSLGRLHMSTRNRGKYTYVAPSHGTRRSQAKNGTWVHISLRIPLGPVPHTSTREVSDEYVPLMKPTTEAFERAACLQRNCLNRQTSMPIGFESTPLQRTTDARATKHDRERQSYKTPDTGYKDQGIPDFASPDLASGSLLSGLRVPGLRVRLTAFRTSRPVYCFQDFASPDFASGSLLSGLRVPGLCVRFSAFRTSRPRTSRPRTSRPDFASPDFESGSLLSGLRVPGLRVRFIAFRTSRPRTSSPVHCFQDFASGLLLSGLRVLGLRVWFSAFRTSRPVYCFQDFASPDFASGLLLLGLRVPGLCVRFNAFRTSRPRTSRPIYCFQDFASPDFASGSLLSGLRVHFTTFRTSCPFYHFSDFASTFTAFWTSRPLYCFLWASTLHLPLHIPQIPVTLLSHDRGGRATTRTTTKAAAETKKGASQGLWLHPRTEHATKEGQAVSTPFWPTGFPHEDSRPKPGTLFIARQSEANRRARGHEQREKS